MPVEQGVRTKYCPNSKENTTNTHIATQCDPCKASPTSILAPTPIFPEFDYARLTIRRLYPGDRYFKFGEQVVQGPPLMVTDATPGTSRLATPAMSEQDGSKEGELKVPSFLREQELSSSQQPLSSLGLGLLVDQPSGVDEFIAWLEEKE